MLAFVVSLLSLAASVGPSHAQSVSSGGSDLRTERRQVRPDCAAMVVPGSVTNDRTYIGGGCVGGLLDGIVVTRFRSGGYVDSYRNGKSESDGLWIARNAAGNYVFTVAFRDESGKSLGAQPCKGTNAAERIASAGNCQAAAAAFGADAFEEAGPLMSRIFGGGPPSGGTPAAGDAPKVLGGSSRP
jgi:hypothetical protein